MRIPLLFRGRRRSSASDQGREGKTSSKQRRFASATTTPTTVHTSDAFCGPVNMGLLHSPTDSIENFKRRSCGQWSLAALRHRVLSSLRKPARFTNCPKGIHLALNHATLLDTAGALCLSPTGTRATTATTCCCRCCGLACSVSCITSHVCALARLLSRSI